MVDRENGLSDEALTALGKSLERIQESGAGMPLGDLVEVANLDLPADLTVSFATQASLGYPVVVMRESRKSALDGILSPREMEIATAVAEGLANKEIAHRLGITLATVKDHVHRILDKTGFANRAALAAALVGRG